MILPDLKINQRYPVLFTICSQYRAGDLNMFFLGNFSKECTNEYPAQPLRGQDQRHQPDPDQRNLQLVLKTALSGDPRMPTDQQHCPQSCLHHLWIVFSQYHGQKSAHRVSHQYAVCNVEKFKYRSIVTCHLKRPEAVTTDARLPVPPLIK